MGNKLEDTMEESGVVERWQFLCRCPDDCIGKRDAAGDTFTHIPGKDNKEILLREWVNHGRLHGIMQEVYFDKDGLGKINGKNLRLRADDISRLEDAIRNRAFPNMRGDDVPLHPEYYGDADASADIEAMRLARESVLDGYAVYYISHKVD